MPALAPTPVISSRLARTPNRNILVVTRLSLPDPGGIQEYVYNRCVHGAEQVVLLTSQVPGDREFDKGQSFPTYRWPVLDLTPRLGMVWLILQQLFNMIWEVLYGLKLYRQYQFEYVEWTHGYDFPAILLLSYLLPIRFFVYLHGDDVLCPLRNPVLGWLFAKTLQRASGIACNSHFTCEFVCRHFRFDTPLHVIHPSVRPEKFQAKISHRPITASRPANLRQANNIPASALVLLSVGRLVRRKGFQRVIAQLPELLRQGLDPYYLICGEGTMATELQTFAKELGVAERVILAGYVPDHQLASYYQATDIFVMPTFYDTQAKSIEGFGIVYIEASYFGKPVVASRIGGVGEAVLHGKTGLLVNPEAPTELFQALYELGQDPELRQQLGRQGEQFANQHPPYANLYADCGASNSVAC